jgi:hypothetical protein
VYAVYEFYKKIKRNAAAGFRLHYNIQIAPGKQLKIPAFYQLGSKRSSRKYWKGILLSGKDNWNRSMM